MKTDVVKKDAWDNIVEPINRFQEQPSLIRGICALILCLIVMLAFIFLACCIAIRMLFLPIVFVTLGAYLVYLSGVVAF